MHPAAPSAAGRQELSRFSAEVFPCMRGVSDLVGSKDVWRLDVTLGVAFRSWDGVGTPISRISRLNTRPTCAPTNAWHPASRQTAHGSGSVWFANLYRTTPSFATPRWFIPALPHVPHQSLSQARATYMPDATWAVSRSSPRFLPRSKCTLGSDAIVNFATRHQWFTRVRLLDSHLTRFSAPFPRRLPPRLLTDAARGGLGPPPAERLRRAYLHL